MNIAILGGTGKEGAGLATRWAIAGHSIIIGSRDPGRAHDKAVELRDKAHKIPIVGHSNREAAALGVPVASVYAGTWAAVDEELVKEGRLKRITKTDEVRDLLMKKKETN